MKRIIAVAALLALAGCASTGYYPGPSPYGTYDSTPYYDAYPPYVYDGYRPYAYDTWSGAPYYYGGTPFIGGGVYYYDRGRDGRHRGDRDGWRQDGDSVQVQPAPAERMDPGNVVRPRAGRPPAETFRSEPATSGMTPSSIRGQPVADAASRGSPRLPWSRKSRRAL